MAHTIRKSNLGNSVLAEITITNYTANLGGEQFNLVEFGLTGSLTGVVLLGSDVVNNPNGCFPVYMGGGKIQLQIREGIELPTTSALNFMFVAFIHAT